MSLSFISDPLGGKTVEEKRQPIPGGAPRQAGRDQEGKHRPERWGASPGSRGREKKAEAAMGEQMRGEVRL